MNDIKEKKIEDIKKEAEEIKCPARQALYFVGEFLDGPMCGKCFPCEMGAYEAKLRLANIVSARGSESDLSALAKIGGEMLAISRCKRGKDTAEFILQRVDSEAFRRHIEGVCADNECEAFIEYRVIPEKCTICGLCREACRDNAIIGEKKPRFRSGYPPFEIRRQRCTKCGECVKACPYGAIEVVYASTPEESTVGV